MIKPLTEWTGHERSHALVSFQDQDGLVYDSGLLSPCSGALSRDVSYGVSMAVEHKLTTGKTFDQILATHRDGLYELIHGEIVEKVPTEEHAKIAGIILGELYLYLKHHPEIKAHLGPEVRYRLEDDPYVPGHTRAAGRSSGAAAVRQGHCKSGL
jgi:hypothetical protein